MNEKNQNIKLLSATSLAKELNISSNDMFNKLESNGLIVRNGNVWDLTPKGKSKGGVYKKGANIDRYIAWPFSITTEFNESREVDSHSLITATTIGKSFDMSATRINSIISELGWIKKDAINGWHVTELGKNVGGVEEKHTTSGVPYVRWAPSIIKNRILIDNVRQATGEVTIIEEETLKDNDKESIGFREKFPAQHRAKDGHHVRSKAELIIDNFLYEAKIVHACERKIPVEEEMYCDFYIPTGKVYIEFWGLDEEKYLARKKRKLEIYEKYHFNLIELFEKDVSNLDDILPGKLRGFGITGIMLVKHSL
jgi:hypothetical protein